MPRMSKASCPFKRVANGEWKQHCLQLKPISLEFITPELCAKPHLWLENTRYLYILRRLAYEGDTESVRILSQLEGPDKKDNNDLKDFIECGKASRLAEAIAICEQSLVHMSVARSNSHS